MTDPRRTSTSNSYLSPQQDDAWSNEAATRSRTGTQALLHVGRVKDEPEPLLVRPQDAPRPGGRAERRLLPYRRW